MVGKDVVGVILAAGRGNRMFPFSITYPKPLLPICNKPLLEYQIESMVHIGIKELIVVIGHLGFEITRVLGDGTRYGVHIRYVEQQELLGIAHAVGQLEPYLSSPFLLFLGDIYFDTRDLDVMLRVRNELRAEAVLAVKEEERVEAIRRNFAVILDHEGLVRRVIEKPRHTKSNLKGCGLYLFDLPIFDAIRRTPRTAMRDEYEITDAVQILIDDGYRVAASPIILRDVNISYPHDLLRCNLLRLKKMGQSKLIAESSEIHPSAHIDNTVIGSQAVVAHPIRITNSVIFPKSQVLVTADIDQVIITPDNVIDCRNSGEIYPL